MQKFESLYCERVFGIPVRREIIPVILTKLGARIELCEQLESIEGRQVQWLDVNGTSIPVKVWGWFLEMVGKKIQTFENEGESGEGEDEDGGLIALFRSMREPHLAVWKFLVNSPEAPVSTTEVVEKLADPSITVGQVTAALSMPIHRKGLHVPGNLHVKVPRTGNSPNRIYVTKAMSERLLRVFAKL